MVQRDCASDAGRRPRPRSRPSRAASPPRTASPGSRSRSCASRRASRDAPSSTTSPPRRTRCSRRPARLDTADLEEAFVAGGPSRGGASPHATSPDLLADLAELCLQRWSRLDTDGTSMKDMHAAFRREPGLLVRALDASIEDEASDVRLVERREGLPEGDLRASVVVQVMAALGRASAREFLAPGNADPIELLLRRRLDALREIAHPATATRHTERTP
ncbi:hypothetical protein WDV94_12845 [Clavibacter tessellarius]